MHKSEPRVPSQQEIEIMQTQENLRSQEESPSPGIQQVETFDENMFVFDDDLQGTQAMGQPVPEQSQ